MAELTPAGSQLVTLAVVGLISAQMALSFGFFAVALLRRMGWIVDDAADFDS